MMIADRSAGINQIRNVASHFSEQLKDLQHGDEVKVAGKITGVTIIPADFFSADTHPIVAVTLDDYIGETRVILRQSYYEHLIPIMSVGDFIVASGLINVVSSSYKKEHSVYAYEVHPLTF